MTILFALHYYRHLFLWADIPRPYSRPNQIYHPYSMQIPRTGNNRDLDPHKFSRAIFQLCSEPARAHKSAACAGSYVTMINAGVSMRALGVAGALDAARQSFASELLAERASARTEVNTPREQQYRLRKCARAALLKLAYVPPIYARSRQDSQKLLLRFRKESKRSTLGASSFLFAAPNCFYHHPLLFALTTAITCVYTYFLFYPGCLLLCARGIQFLFLLILCNLRLQQPRDLK